MEDFQNPPPPSGGPPPGGRNQTQIGNGTAPGGAGAPSPPGFLAGTTSQSQPFGPQGTSNTDSANGPTTTGPAQFGPNNFAVDQQTTSSAPEIDTQTYEPQDLQASPTTSSAGADNGVQGPSFGDMTSQDTSSPTETSPSATTPNSPYRKKKKMRRQAPPPGFGGPGGAGPPGPPGGGRGPPSAPTAAFGLLTYKTSSGSIPSDSSIFQTPPNNLTDTMPIVIHPRSHN